MWLLFTVKRKKLYGQKSKYSDFRWPNSQQSDFCAPRSILGVKLSTSHCFDQHMTWMSSHTKLVITTTVTLMNFRNTANYDQQKQEEIWQPRQAYVYHEPFFLDQKYIVYCWKIFFSNCEIQMINWLFDNIF